MRLKFTILFLLVLSCFSTQLFSQISVGFRGGISSSSVTYRYQLGRAAINADGIRDFTYAFVIEYFGQKNAGLQLEIQSLTLGYTQENDSLGVNISEWNYLKVPILSNFYFGNRGRFHIKIGPHFGYLLNAVDVQRDYENPPTGLPTYGQEGDDPNKFMYGLTLGAGLSNLFGKSTLAGDVRLAYEFGRPESQDRIFDMNSTTLEISITYLFLIRKRKNQN
ncbi:outer membrane beta-barrel protein [Shivajiella indica]|uniref:Outer membrane beta-barrel protein n=1 Tax=Shivajiella indica TaxID=872115 RepID=A0ABW5B1V9_9BACT